MLTIGEKLLGLRKARHIDREEAAEALGLPYTTLASYEKNQRTPRSNMLCKMADFYNVSVDYLIGREEPDDVPTNNAKWDGTLQSLRDDERILLSTYRGLNDDDRRFLQRQLDLLRKERERGDA